MHGSAPHHSLTPAFFGCRFLYGGRRHSTYHHAGDHKAEEQSKVIHNAPPFISSSETIIFRIFLKSVLSGYNCIIVSLSDTVNTIYGTLYKIFGLIFIS
jgi:hypothetical protein